MESLQVLLPDSHNDIALALRYKDSLSDERFIKLYCDQRTDRGNKAKKTILAYTSDIAEFRNFLKRYTNMTDGEFPLKEVTYELCAAYVNWMDEEIVTIDESGNRTVAKRFAPATQNRRVKTIKSMYTFGMGLKYFTSTPWTLIKTPRQNPSGSRISKKLTVEQIERIQEVAQQDVKADAIVSTFLSTGCRREELCGAKWKDLYYTEAKDGSILVWNIHGKGSKDRTVKMHPTTFRKIIKYRQKAGLTTTIGEGDTPLFCSLKTKPYHVSSVSLIIKNIGIEAGIPELSCHYFRHSHGSISLADGANILKVQKQLGHSSIQVTQRYLHELDEFEDTAVDSIKRIHF